MSKQEADKIKIEQESHIEDLPVDDAQQDEVKGGAPLTYKLVYNRAD
jgi:hypothetical protein